jgi:superfamily II DNA or RNA helicase
MKDRLSPRPYQWECISAVYEHFDYLPDQPEPNGIRRYKRPAVVLPTGAGKTVIFSWISHLWTEARKRSHPLRLGRVVILVHRDELVDQTLNKLHAVDQTLSVGTIRGKEDDHAGRDVIVASVQTLRRPERLRRVQETGRIGLVIVDECHHATAASYRRIMDEFGCFEEITDPMIFAGAYAVGFTATLQRADSARLSDVWQSVIYRRDILDMIAGYTNEHDDFVPGGYLVNPRGKLVTVDGLSLSEVATSGGDYQLGSLSDALMSADAPDFVANAYMEHAPDKPGVVFTPTVETAHAFAEALSRRGLSTLPVWGAMPAEARKEAVSSFRNGGTQILVNCMVLTEGFDAPRAEVAVIARPTQSASLYVQMVGRVLRPFPGKTSALVLDIVGASREHRLASLCDLTSERIQVINEGESLMEAVAREKEARNPALRDYVVTYEDIDLFQRAARANFLQTHEGVWFVAGKSDVWFIWPGKEAGTYNVGVRPLEGRGGLWLHKNVTLEQAMAWAETEAISADDDMVSYARRDAAWRRRKEPATNSQLLVARRFGVTPPAGVTKRELSDMISVARVSAILDKNLKKRQAK